MLHQLFYIINAILMTICNTQYHQLNILYFN